MSVGNYHRKPVAELEALVRAFNEGAELPPEDEPDEWDEITATESPVALEKDPRGKRSGVYVRTVTEVDELIALRARCSGEAGS